MIFLLSDDHRFDFLGFHPNAPKWLETPALDRMAREGVYFANAFVSTSLCSPSRASILTGQYMHRHKIVDNQRAEPAGTVFFPQYLQKAGMQTAYVGKWHMGHDDDQPRPGFDYWTSYKGQGEYTDPTLNINGKHQQLKGYDADVLTDLAIQWLDKERNKDKRTERYKYVYHHGTWDIDSFHNLELDPIERHNLIDVPDQQERIAALHKKLFEEMDKSGGLNLPLR
ncbi:MAG: sulfatase-like hydrolase/transferase [Phycisphaeraceae bacterium]